MSTEAKTTSAKIAAAEVLIIGLYGLIKRALGEATGQPEGVKGEIYARVILSVRKMIKTAAYLDPASGLPRVLFPARHPLAKLMSEQGQRRERCLHHLQQQVQLGQADLVDQCRQ